MDTDKLSEIEARDLVFVMQTDCFKVQSAEPVRPQLSVPEGYLDACHESVKQEVFRTMLVSAGNTEAGGPRTNQFLPQGVVVQLLSNIPSTLHELEGKFQLACDTFLVVRPDLVFLAGWIFDPLNAIESLQLVSADGQAIEIKPLLVHFPRPDIIALTAPFFGRREFEKHGFVATIPVVPTYWDRGARVVTRLRSGQCFESGVNKPSAWDPFDIRLALLRNMPGQPYYDERMMESMQRALGASQTECARHFAVARTFECGKPPENPDTSVIIPLYKRVDFMQHQMAHFVSDPSLRNTEFIYVLDSPEDEHAFVPLALQLFSTYQVPFRGLIVERNTGYGPANNLGAMHARGRNLLFLNSDVFPTETGWLNALLGAQARTPNVGVVGGKLLFQDTSLQHAGMYFDRSMNINGLWWNWHYYKGFPSSFPPADVPRTVPAITGALMLIDRAVFEGVGGWDERYLLADFEDSDLCIRLYNKGLCSRYEPSATLWHLEGQSRVAVSGDNWRQNVTYYNCWQQTNRWKSVIEEIMRNAADASRA